MVHTSVGQFFLFKRTSGLDSNLLLSFERGPGFSSRFFSFLFARTSRMVADPILHILRLLFPVLKKQIPRQVQFQTGTNSIYLHMAQN
jgi:hypothetical protein